MMAPAEPATVTKGTLVCWAIRDRPAPHRPPASVDVVMAKAAPSEGLGGGGGVSGGGAGMGAGAAAEDGAGTLAMD